MGLIKAASITSVIYFVWKFIEKRILNNVSEEFRQKVSPWIPIILIFCFELLF